MGLYLLIEGIFLREDLESTLATYLAMLFFSATWSTDIFAAKLRANLKIINNNLDYYYPIITHQKIKQLYLK